MWMFDEADPQTLCSQKEYFAFSLRTVVLTGSLQVAKYKAGAAELQQKLMDLQKNLGIKSKELEVAVESVKSHEKTIKQLEQEIAELGATLVRALSISHALQRTADRATQETELQARANVENELVELYNRTQESQGQNEESIRSWEAKYQVLLYLSFFFSLHPLSLSPSLSLFLCVYMCAALIRHRSPKRIWRRRGHSSRKRS
jgi:signal recognition particle GTPase